MDIYMDANGNRHVVVDLDPKYSELERLKRHLAVIYKRDCRCWRPTRLCCLRAAFRARWWRYCCDLHDGHCSACVAEQALHFEEDHPLAYKLNPY
jgi:hypothetical protein